MEIRTVERLGAAGAVAGGALRIAGDFLPTLHASSSAIEQAYFVTDLFLLLGAFALFARNASRIGWTGLVGFLVFFVGILFVRSPQVGSAIGGYRTAAAIALIGINGFGVAMLVTQTARIAPMLWLGSLVAGIAASGGVQPELALVASGALFGLGFVVAGMRELRS
jgi:hypothetical protein